MTKFVRLSEKGSQVCWEIDEEGNRCTGQLDEWGNLIDRYGRVYVDDVVGVGDVEKHGRCYTKVEGVLLRDKVRKGLVRTYLDGISVGDVYKNGVTKRCREVIAIIQSTYDGMGKISLRKVVRDNVRVVDISKKLVTHKIVDWVRLLDADIRERISEYGLYVWASLDEVGSYVSGRVDEWGMLVEERLTRGGGMWWFVRKIFVEEIDVGDGLWKRPTRVGREVVGIVEKTWVRVSKRISDGVGVIDSVVRRPGKVVSESILASDGMGRVSLRKGVRDEIRLVDVSKKRVTHKVVDWLRLLDSDVREVMSEWGNRVWRSLDEMGSYVGGRLDEWGMVNTQRITLGGSLTWRITKRFVETLEVVDTAHKRVVAKTAQWLYVTEKRRVDVAKRLDDMLIGITDVGVKIPGKMLSDDVGIVDSATKRVGTTRVDGIRLTEGLIGRTITRVVNDTIGVVDTLRRVRLLTLEEALGVVDHTGKSIVRSVQDRIRVVDKQWKGIGKTLGEALSIGDTTWKHMVVVLNDTLGVVDTISKRVVTAIVVEPIRVVDYQTRRLTRYVSEGIAILDSDIRQTIDEWGLLITGSINEVGSKVVDTIDEWGVTSWQAVMRGGQLIIRPIKVGVETLALTEGLSKWLTRIVSDHISLSDIFSRWHQTLVELSEILNVQDAKRVVLSKVVKNTIRFKDIVRKTPTRVVAERLQLSDWTRRVMDCVVGFKQSIGVRKIGDAFAVLRNMGTKSKKRYSDTEVNDD